MSNKGAKANKMVDPADKESAEMVEEDTTEEAPEEETAPEPETKSKFKKGTLVCMRRIRDNSGNYNVGDKYKGEDKAFIKKMIKRGTIRKV